MRGFKLFVYFTLMALFFGPFWGCKKDLFNNPFKEDFRVRGTIYFDRNQFPMSYVDLILYDVNISSRSGKPKPIAYATSDIAGNYEFFYEYKDSYSSLYIAKDHDGNYRSTALGILQQNIPPHENIEVDLYKESYGKYKIRVNPDIPFSSGDTLYVGGLHTYASELYYRENLLGTGKGGFAIPFPFISNEFGPFDTYRIPNYNQATFYEAYYGVGKTQFMEAFNGDSTLRGSVGILAPPQVTTLVVDL